MNNSDELRTRLTKLAGEMHYGIELACLEIRRAIKDQPSAQGPSALGWTKGMQDALTLLRTAEGAQHRFKQWMSEVISLEIDACGLTAEERRQIVSMPHPREV